VYLKLYVSNTQTIFYRAIDIIEDTYNVILLFLFVYFAILFAFYGFRIITVSIFKLT